MVTKHKNHLGI